MEKNITVIDLSDDTTDDAVIELPKVCPRCGQSGKPQQLDAFVARSLFDDEDVSVSVVYFCTSCEKLFIGEYPVDEDLALEGHPSYHPVFLSDRKQFPDNIQKFFTRFVDIYNQSYEAEQRNLTEICGMGYRKALEVLVRDFAILLHPEKEDDIKKAHLSPCIETYIQDEEIKDLAKASAWLGNDETHYIKKHEDYSIEDLKEFIEAMVGYINSKLAVKKARELLNRPKALTV